MKSPRTFFCEQILWIVDSKSQALIVMPLVSVIIPCYNPTAYLTDAIKSVLDQTLQDFDIVVVDDGSELDVRSLLPDDERIIYARREHNGVAISRNIGFSLTTGEFVALLDADDLWHAKKLERQVKLMQDNRQIALCYTNVATLDERFGRQPSPIEVPGDLQVDFLLPALQIMAQCNICTSTVMIRRECLNVCGWFDPLLAYSEDYDLFLRIGRFFPRLGYVPTAEVSYRLSDGSVSAKYKRAYKLGCETLERHHRFGKHVRDLDLVRVTEDLRKRLSTFCAEKAYDNCRLRLKKRELLAFATEFCSALRLRPHVVMSGLSHWLGKRLRRVN